MIQKIKSYVLIVTSALMLAAPGLVPAVASAAADCQGNNIANKVGEGASAAAGVPGSVSCAPTGADGSAFTKIAQSIVNIFSIIVGAIAIIMIIYGGFRYITSGGDSGRVGSAKNTLIYAIVGLIIVALAQFIVHIVLAQTSSATTGV